MAAETIQFITEQLARPDLLDHERFSLQEALQGLEALYTSEEFLSAEWQRQGQNFLELGFHVEAGY